MVARCYEFAGLRVTIRGPEDLMYEREGRLAPFRVPGDSGGYEFELERVDALPAPEGNWLVICPSYRVYEQDGVRARYTGSVGTTWETAYLRTVQRGRFHKIQLLRDQVPGRVGLHTVLGALNAEHLVVRSGGVILHAACIVHEGRAVLFTAPSETGKSTQAELWRRNRGAAIVNGDRIAIRMEEGKPVACGIPFAGSSDYCGNVTAPLGAIVYLGQAARTSIEPLRGFRAFRAVWEGCSVNTWDRQDTELATELVQTVLRTVPVFRLDCTPDESAVTALEEAWKGRI